MTIFKNMNFYFSRYDHEKILICRYEDMHTPPPPGAFASLKKNSKQQVNAHSDNRQKAIVKETSSKKHLQRNMR